MSLLEAMDSAIHFLFLVALAPLVLSALCWLRYGPPAQFSPTMAHPDRRFGEVFGT